MKKLSLLLLIGSIAFVGCKPDDGKDDPKKADTAPTSYTQKAVLEYFSGAWCGFCPRGRMSENAIRDNVNPNQFMAVVYHADLGAGRRDMMDIVYDDQIDPKFNKVGYPSGMINRINGTTGGDNTWQGLVDAVLTEKAKCGLALSSTKNGNDLDVTVKLGIGSEAMPSGNYFMTVLLVEKEMTGTGDGWDQRNYYSEFGSAVGGPNHPYYKYPDPIIGYVHKNVVRAVLQTNQLGDKIDAAALEAGALTEFDYSWDLTGLDSDLQIVAFISEYTDNPAVTGIESSFVYNAQIADINTNKDFD